MSSIRRNRTVEDDENPAWDEDEFAEARPAADVLPEMLDSSASAELLKPKRGRPPKAQTKKQISMRLDRDVLAYYRSLGPGWQTEINAVLRRSMQRKRR